MSKIGGSERAIRDIIVEIDTKGANLTADIKRNYTNVLENVIKGWHSNPGNEGAKTIHKSVNSLLEVIAKDTSLICNTIQDAANSVENAINKNITVEGADGTVGTVNAYGDPYGVGGKFKDVDSSILAPIVQQIELDLSRLYKTGDDFYIIKEVIEDVESVIPEYQHAVLGKIDEMEEIFDKLGGYGFLTDNSDIIDSGKAIFRGLRTSIDEDLMAITKVISGILNESRISYDKALQTGAAKLKEINFQPMNKTW